MLYKLTDGQLDPCPDCGVSGGMAISNLPLYYADNPDIALADGYKPLIEDIMPNAGPGTVVVENYEETETEILKHYDCVAVD